MTLKLNGTVSSGTVSSWFNDGDLITSDMVKDYLEANPEYAEIEISSHGGDVFVGIDICNMLRKHGNSTVTITSHAYSAGAVIASGAKKVRMYNNATLLVHCALTFVYGNAQDLRKTAENLEAIDTGLINGFLERFNGTKEELKVLMDSDKILTAEESLKYGFVDEIIDKTEEESEETEETEEDKKEKIKNVIDKQKILNEKYAFSIFKNKKEESFLFDKIRRG